MKNSELVDRLQSTTLSPGDFHHGEHLRAAWAYLGRWGLAETLDRFPHDLRRFAETAGQPDLFHLTITWTFLLAINERRERLADSHTWEEFADRFPELFEWKPFVGRYYSDELLFSDLAREEFVLPDRLAKAAGASAI